MTAGGADPYFGVQQGVLVSLANDGSVSVLRFVSYSTNTPHPVIRVLTLFI